MSFQHSFSHGGWKNICSVYWWPSYVKCISVRDHGRVQTLILSNSQSGKSKSTWPYSRLIGRYVHLSVIDQYWGRYNLQNRPVQSIVKTTSTESLCVYVITNGWSQLKPWCKTAKLSSSQTDMHKLFGRLIVFMFVKVTHRMKTRKEGRGRHSTPSSLHQLFFPKKCGWSALALEYERQAIGTWPSDRNTKEDELL